MCLLQACQHYVNIPRPRIAGMRSRRLVAIAEILGIAPASEPLRQLFRARDGLSNSGQTLPDPDAISGGPPFLNEHEGVAAGRWRSATGVASPGGARGCVAHPPRAARHARLQRRLRRLAAD